ncbi:MAG: hypothetical protein V4489_10460 [Chlamydiota bacterium]
MIKHVGQQISSYIRATTIGQKYTALENLASSAFKPIKGEVQEFKVTQKLLLESGMITEKVKMEMPTALSKDHKGIQQASVMIANDILNKCYPDQAFNPLYTKFFMRHKEGFADSLLESLSSSEGVESPLENHRKEYKMRQELLGGLSSDLESFLVNVIKKETLFKEPLIKYRLSDSNGQAEGTFSQIKMDGVTMPEELGMTITYKEGSLQVTLQDKYDRLNEYRAPKAMAFPLPHIKPVADAIQSEQKKHKENAPSYTGIYAKINKWILPA